MSISLNMPPCFSQSNRTDLSLTHIIIFSNLFMRARIFPDVQNIFLSKFRRKVFFAKRAVATSFFKHICHVIPVGSHKKMIWVYAGWIVANMTNKLAFWDRPFIKLPSNAVGWPHIPAANAKLPVTLRCPRALPYPAFIAVLLEKMLKTFKKSAAPFEVVPLDKSHRLAFGMTKAFKRIFCNTGRMSASAFA